MLPAGCPWPALFLANMTHLSVKGCDHFPGVPEVSETYSIVLAEGKDGGRHYETWLPGWHHAVQLSRHFVTVASSSICLEVTALLLAIVALL